jgi:hypothetical protein
LWNLVAQEPENKIALFFTIGPDNPLRNDPLEYFLAGKHRNYDFLLSSFATFFIIVHISQIGINLFITNHYHTLVHGGYFPSKIRLTAGGSAPPRLRRAGPGALGHFRLVAIIVTTNLKPHSGVRSKSIGQVACSHMLGRL